MFCKTPSCALAFGENCRCSSYATLKAKTTYQSVSPGAFRPTDGVFHDNEYCPSFCQELLSPWRLLPPVAVFSGNLQRAGHGAVPDEYTA